MTIDFGNTIDEDINRYIIGLFEKILKQPVEGVTESIPAYSSITVFYDTYALHKKVNGNTSVCEWMKERLERFLSEAPQLQNGTSWVVRIPVCYKDEFAINKSSIMEQTKLPFHEIVGAHTAKTYRVYMLGFLPGFAYMGKVDENIAVSRRQFPGPVPAGSVGIAGQQTGIYPLNSPGGWQVIGRTPIKLFKTYQSASPDEIPKDEISLLHPGDTVEFYSISKQEFADLEKREEEFEKNAALYRQKYNEEKPGLKIIRSGILDSVQDLGRYNYQYLGINPSGVTDRFAAQVVNMLVGNDADDAVIEMHFPSSIILFEQEAMIAIGGADFTATINGEEAPAWQPIMVSRNSLIEFKYWKGGARCYMAVREKLHVLPWLNSQSTNLKAVCGGFNGRSFQKDDVIPFRNKHIYKIYLLGKDHLVLPWKADIDWDTPHREKIAVLPGNEWDWLTEESQETFLNHHFAVDPSADRMGYRLQGSLSSKENKELVSSAVNFGTIQLLPNGELIVLMSDHQTTGGYPRIAHVISADLSKLAQTKPGDELTFEFVSQKQAEDLLIKQKHHLLQLQNACTFRLQEFLNK